MVQESNDFFLCGVSRFLQAHYSHSIALVHPPVAAHVGQDVLEPGGGDCLELGENERPALGEGTLRGLVVGLVPRESRSRPSTTSALTDARSSFGEAEP